MQDSKSHKENGKAEFGRCKRLSFILFVCVNVRVFSVQGYGSQLGPQSPHRQRVSSSRADSMYFHHLLSTLGFSLTSTDQQSVDPNCFICTHSAPPPSSDSSSNTAQKDSLSSGCVSHVQLSYELAKPQRGRFEPRLVDANASTLQWPDRLYALPSVSVAMVPFRRHLPVDPENAVRPLHIKVFTV